MTTTFTTTANAYDVRIECDVCHDSNSGSGARAWAGSHHHVPTCTATQDVPVGYDETVFCVCNSIRGHAGAHTWIEA